MLEYIVLFIICAFIALTFAFLGAKIALKNEHRDGDIMLKYLLAESEMERLLDERDEAMTEAFHLRCKYEGSEADGE